MTSAEPQSPRRIVLYAAVTSARGKELVDRRPMAMLRRAVRRALDRVAWRFAGRFTAHPYHYARQSYSNLGDEAIRVVIERQLRAALPREFVFEELAWGRLGSEEAKRLDDGKTVIVIAGGGYYRFGVNGDVHDQVARDVDALSRVRCPVVSYGTGVNYNILPGASAEFTPSPAAVALLNEHFRHVAYCAVRDDFSRKLLQPYALDPIDVIADPVFFLEPLPPQAAPSDVLRVGVNLAFHGLEPMAVLAVWIHAARDLLLSIARRQRVRFTYFVHSDTEHGIVRLLRDSGVDMEVVDADPVSLADAYSGIDVHVCQMMHSSIMSTRLGIPTLVVAYDRKHYSFFELLGLPRFCIPAERATLEYLTTLFDELVSRRDEIRAHLVSRRNALSDAQDASLREVASLLSSIPTRPGPV
ncbi:MAG: polysaccharide pyruvyl transferase family protein [Alphaproteobacteria bacterium]|nr:polysaccharide pyruvyl transferase family protein [Alphaproteobacteria bacterium]